MFFFHHTRKKKAIRLSSLGYAVQEWRGLTTDVYISAFGFTGDSNQPLGYNLHRVSDDNVKNNTRATNIYPPSGKDHKAWLTRDAIYGVLKQQILIVSVRPIFIPAGETFIIHLLQMRAVLIRDCERRI